MHRTSFVAGLAVLLALAGALTTDAPAPARAAGSWTYNFESDLIPLERGRGRLRDHDLATL